MTKKQLRKEAHKSIFKDGKTHTQTFLELKPKTDWPDESLADLISGITSKEKHEETKSIWVVYMAVLGAIVLLRIFYISLVVQEIGASVTPLIIIPMVAFSLFVPAWGIYTVYNGMRHNVYTVAAFLTFGVFRGLQQSNFQLTWDSYVVFGLIAALLVLSTLLWSKWKTPYSKNVELKETENGASKKLRYQFEDDLNLNADILDDHI